MSTWPRAQRRNAIVALVVALFVVGALLRSPVDALEDDESDRDALLEDAIDRGMSRAQASCFVDGLEEEIGPDLQTSDLSSGDARATLEMTFRCLGADLGGDDCLVDAVFEIMELEGADATEFVAAEARLGAGDRERMMVAGLECQGLSEDAATCAAEAMRAEFGDDVFEQERGPGATAAGQRRIAELVADCEVDVPIGGGGTVEVPTECGAYARSIASAWDQIGLATDEAPPAAVVLAVAEAVERSAPDAPPEVAEDVAALAEAARAHAEEVEEEHGDSAAEVAFFDAFEISDVEREAQIRIWRTCPNLDGELPGPTTALALALFAIGGSQADMEDELLDCIESDAFSTPGDNAGCDQLVDACQSGTYEACDDIWVWSDLGSEYEEIGASCGGRLQDDDDLYGQGACEILGG